MNITTINRKGVAERRRHIPYRLVQSGNSWLAYHALTGKLVCRADSCEIAERTMRSMTESAP